MNSGVHLITVFWRNYVLADCKEYMKKSFMLLKNNSLRIAMHCFHHFHQFHEFFFSFVQALYFGITFLLLEKKIKNMNKINTIRCISDLDTWTTVGGVMATHLFFLILSSLGVVYHHC